MKKILFVVTAVLLLCMLGFHVQSKNKIPVRITLFYDGAAHTVDLETGKTTSAAIGEYCKTNRTTVVWAKKETETICADQAQHTAYSVWLTEEQGNSRCLFHASQLYEQTGMYRMDDLAITKNHRIFFTAGNANGFYLYEYEKGNCVQVTDSPVLPYFWLQENKLYVTSLTSEAASRITVYDAGEDCFDRLGTGANFAENGSTERWYSDEPYGAMKRHDRRTKEVTLLSAAATSAYQNVYTFAPPLFSQNGDYALVYYFESMGKNSEANATGIYDRSQDVLIDLEWYFKRVLLKRKPQHFVTEIPGHAMFQIVAD